MHLIHISRGSSMKESWSISRRKRPLPLLCLLFGLLPAGWLSAQEYDIKFYGIDVEADNNSDNIRGEVTILAQAGEISPEVIELDLVQSLDVQKVSVNGSASEFSHSGDKLNIWPDGSIPAGSHLDIRIQYGGQTGDGMLCEVDEDWGARITYTSTEPYFARDWFPCRQDLNDKADSVHVSITTDSHLMAVSQGLHTATTYFPNGKVRYEWKSNYPTAYYLISIAVGEYQEYNIHANPAGLDPILIQNFVYDKPGCLETYREQINATIPIMELFCERFGPYPHREEKYGHYLWPRGGGMEHQTMTGMGNFEFYLVAHELGHSWFGNYVTCGTWQDIWINEGFATFAGYMATEVLGPEYAPGERDYRYERALREPGGSVYIPEHEMTDWRRIFSGNLSYNKGMALIYMMRYELQDDELFYEVLREFVTRHANSTATGMEFKAVLEELTMEDFTTFFDQWYFGQGFPVYEVNWTQEGSLLTLNVSQEGSSVQTPLFEMSMEYRLSWNGGDTLVRVWHDESQESYVFNVPGEVTAVEVDPENHVLNQLAGQAEKKAAPVIAEIFPNPVPPSEGRFSFRVKGEDILDIHLQIYSAEGRMVYSGLFEACMPGSVREVYPGMMEPGIYLLRMEGGGQSTCQKILIK